jgi:hypothetical protein
MRSSLFDSSALGTDRSGSKCNDFNPIGRARLICRPLAKITKQIHNIRSVQVDGIVVRYRFDYVAK